MVLAPEHLACTPMHPQSVRKLPFQLQLSTWIVRPCFHGENKRKAPFTLRVSAAWWKDGDVGGRGGIHYDHS